MVSRNGIEIQIFDTFPLVLCSTIPCTFVKEIAKSFPSSCRISQHRLLNDTPTALSLIYNLTTSEGK